MQVTYLAFVDSMIQCALCRPNFRFFFHCNFKIEITANVIHCNLNDQSITLCNLLALLLTLFLTTAFSLCLPCFLLGGSAENFEFNSLVQAILFRYYFCLLCYCRSDHKPFHLRYGSFYFIVYSL